MDRRIFLSGLLPGLLTAAPEPLFGSRRGTAVMLDVASGKPLAIEHPDIAGRLLARPGSTLKPLALYGMLRNGKLSPHFRQVCRGHLTAGGRNFTCSHPQTRDPFDVPSAIAYSCNEYVFRAAARLGQGELAAALQGLRLGARTGLVTAEASPIVEPLGGEGQQVQALGEAGVKVTALSLAMAYRELALQADRHLSNLDGVFEGLEAAVEAGTAQKATDRRMSVAGKTGTSTSDTPGKRLAWFAGYAPVRRPQRVVVVMVEGGSGGKDAAPIAAKLFARS